MIRSVACVEATAPGSQRDDMYEREDPMPGMFCCCEFTDRHGRQSHLADGSCCDDFVNGCCSHGQPPSLRSVCADLDDRLRLPMHGGALYRARLFLELHDSLHLLCPGAGR